MAEETLLDAAHQAMEAAPEDGQARLAFYERLAAGELFLLLESEDEGEMAEFCNHGTILKHSSSHATVIRARRGITLSRAHARSSPLWPVIDAPLLQRPVGVGAQRLQRQGRIRAGIGRARRPGTRPALHRAQARQVVQHGGGVSDAGGDRPAEFLSLIHI